MTSQNSVADKPAPKRALIVMSVQNEYFTGNLRLPYKVSEQVLANIVRTMKAAKEAKIPVIVVQHQTSGSEPIFVEGTNGFELHDAIKDFPADYCFVKKLPSAFAGTELQDFLRHLDIDTISLVGFLAQRGIIATAQEGRCLGYSCEFIYDASASLPQTNQAGRASGGEIHRAVGVMMHASFAATSDTNRWLEAVQSNSRTKRMGLYLSYDLAVGMD